MKYADGKAAFERATTHLAPLLSVSADDELYREFRDDPDGLRGERYDGRLLREYHRALEA